MRNGCARLVVVLLGLLFSTSGCAALSDSLSTDSGSTLTALSESPIGTSGAQTHQADPGLLDPSQPDDASEKLATAPRAVESAVAPLEAFAQAGQTPGSTSTSRSETPPEETPPKDAADEFYDPFAKKEEGAGEGEDYDPWEGFNSVMFEFNRKVDQYIIKPVAQVYEKIMPDALERGIDNFFHNARFGPRLINNLLQLKVKGTAIELGRFLINSTLGLAGFFDPAKHWFGLETPDEDTGQTLGVYGVPPGPYLVLPLLPPLTVRDFFGLILDFGADPINYFVFPTFEVDDWPSAIAHKNRDTTTIAQLGTRVEEIVNYRSLTLEKFQGVEEATVDLYSAVRNAYLQKRAKAIRE